MKSLIKAFVKRVRMVYIIYYYLGSFLLRLMGLFVKTDPKLILFISYGGQKYDDSPKVVYEYLKDNPTYNEYKYIWAFTNPEEFPQVENKVKVDSLAYYIVALRAGYWFTNSSASRGLNFRKKGTKNILFQHGMAGLKMLGADIQQSQKTFRINFQEKFDAIFIEGKKEVDILTRAWKMEKCVFHTTGLPRNDDLVDVTTEEIDEIKNRMRIPTDKKVILYAPTFRELSRGADGRNTLAIPIEFKKWETVLGDKYVMLVTAHYEVAKLLDELPDNHFVINAFKYPYINDLLKISDILISDYSSVVFDYSILEKPILCYGYDYDSYAVERGLYTDIEKLFSHGVIRTDAELLDIVSHMNYEYECDYTKKYIKEEYIAAYGNAAEKTLKIIFNL